jgi:SpoVK/Ycf46/Vps4 family AAA+-type ATPase
MSGVTQDQLGILLSYMQDQAAAGMIFVGPPGAAKSAVAKAAGNEAGIPTIQLDLGAAKGSLVGQSELQIRNALKVITAVSNGRSLWIATCNAIADLPPELRRRFTLGTFFFDLPDAAERAAIWEIHIANYFGHEVRSEGRVARGKKSVPRVSTLGPRPADDGWTGAEIRNCCEIAWRLGCSLVEAAAFIVPVSRSAADQIQRLREQADGRFLSASAPGVYRRRDGAAQANDSYRKLEVV